MDFLLIGKSRFAQRRVLPAAAALPFDSITVASRREGTNWRTLAGRKPGLVYVSLANGEHAEAVLWALRCGNHVVVDKPAFLTLAEARSAMALARESSLVLAEATCYSYHPMFAWARALDATFTKAVAVFTPPVPATDFRHDRSRGGGALLDTGPYFASLGRVLWGAEPDRVQVIVGDRAPDGLELSYSVLAGYPGDRTVIGQFGFTTGYRNALHLLGPDAGVDFERPFSAPPDLSPTVRVAVHGTAESHQLPPADSMLLFLTRVLEAAGSGTREFDEPLLSDARTRDHLTRAADLGLSGRVDQAGGTRG
ncbi:Gfo/Idh/MocA family oxidoreductase [Micromonospora sp. DR5-3]|uniref:Gfo/Idh/MocA family protein n=1 Tax=unclassified Micromonospora TaxID=2617518 RepID=UPI0011DBB93C|nr:MULTISPECIES: Gfo/Idh/MocA family oxidoreductase [unclassified Micromonospora]MCW3818294.1 Gfo/Idh/MocA family oxidoreductase [Micromonospora sp. DR5-3]TYC21169.1 Gfo/Idh/MocA family oxidoreductase [Micromonospora sp. MP36]